MTGILPMSDAETVNIIVGNVNGPPTMNPPEITPSMKAKRYLSGWLAFDPDQDDTLTYVAGDLPRALRSMRRRGCLNFGNGV